MTGPAATGHDNGKAHGLHPALGLPVTAHEIIMGRTAGRPADPA